MRYIPNTARDQEEMLKAIGLESLSDLFVSIPEAVRLNEKLEIPEALGEKEMLAHIKALGEGMAHAGDYACFLGAGSYNHYLPAVIDHLIQRSEFYTSYTPYQSEISQGTLQAIYEFQTLVCQLTGMEVANASMYDGASALAEAVIMARNISRSGRCLISRAVHPEYRRVVGTYVSRLDLELVEIPYAADGTTDLDALAAELERGAGAVALQSPNFFGCLEDLDRVGEMASGAGAQFIACFTEALSLGLLKPPGECGADIVCGEGQSLGLPMSYGGPYLGLMATRAKNVRRMPGRLAGATTELDGEGRDGFVLTLSTREQHIRRERATSNICTNEGLCALIACIYMCLLGREGMREAAHRNLSNAEYAKKALAGKTGCEPAFAAPTFNEFVIRLRENPEEAVKRLAQQKILAGVPLGRFYPELTDCMLVCVTENVTKAQIDSLVGAL